MTSRPRQHQLEDVSKARHLLMLPPTWVVRDKSKDYGIDVEVEIFDENGQHTGLVYWVQLKATDSTDNREILNFDLQIEKIREYQRLDVPVLIARYSASENNLYIRWAHQIDLYYAKPTAKTFRITFAEENKWKEDTASALKAHLIKRRSLLGGRLERPISLSLSLKSESFNGVPKAVVAAKLRRALNAFGDIVHVRGKSKRSLVSVSLSAQELVVDLGGVTGCTIHSIDEGEQSFAATMAAHCIVSTAVCLIGIGQTEMAAEICFDDRIRAVLARNSEILMQLIPHFLPTSRFSDVVDLVREGSHESESNYLEAAVLANSVTLGRMTESDRHKLEELLHYSLRRSIKSKDRKLIGSAHFNLASHYRANGYAREAAAHLLRARKSYKDYEERHYFFGHLGGVFFALERFSCAVNCYKKALDLGAPSSTHPLYADALLFNGQYAASHDAFSKYLRETQGDQSEWELKLMFLDTMIGKTGVSVQQRRPHAQTNLAIEEASDDTEGLIAELQTAINLDWLNGNAWFNFGVAVSRAKNTAGAFFAFLASALSQTADLDAWANATICGLNGDLQDKGHFTSLLHTVRAAYCRNGDHYLEVLHSKLSEQVHGEALQELTTMIDALLPEERTRPDNVDFSVHGDGDTLHIEKM